MKIVVAHGKGYRIAAKEFQKYYYQITSQMLEIVAAEDYIPKEEDLVLVGASFVNPVSLSMEFDDVISAAEIKAGSDEYIAKTFRDVSRRILFIAGGNVRATLYAVYDYFETCYGCSWYWDGDVVPKSQESFPNADIVKKPRFQYRGLRYFAHRGCKRFQAEMWGLEDWKKEIDYLLKKKLNLFMLRIGQDDLFQKAFPETVSYPECKTLNELNYSSDDTNDYFGAQGYNDRRPFWTLKYRGELRKKVLEYAFDRGLMHPEDCGTMTHWYSPTPNDFLEKNPVEFLAPKGARTKNTLVFDIRKEREFGYYTQLTKAHIEHYGKAEIFHTIGLAEQFYSEDRIKNFRMKKYVYDRYAEYLQETYPTCPVFIAGWDLWLTYQGNEVSKLVASLDEKQCIIFDYTSDSAYTGNFTTWGVVGNFPYVFGIFHAYESGNDMVGQYDRTQERLTIAKDDDYCKGLIFWPELSHSDTLIQEFLSVNAWESDVVPVELCIDRISKGRAGKYSAAMASIWKNFLPIVKLMHWNMREESPSWNAFYYYYTPMRFLENIQSGKIETLFDGLDYDKAIQLLPNAACCLKEIVSLPQEALESDLIARDITDIVRTIIGRYIHIILLAEGVALLQEKDGKKRRNIICCYAQQIEILLESLKRILSSSTDFSLYHTLIEISKESRVYDYFEQTLKNNTVADYCRSNIYETVKELFVPEQKILQNALLSFVDDNTYDMQVYMAKGQKEILKKYMNKPLAEIDREKKYTIVEAVKYAYEIFDKIRIEK